MNLQNLLLQLKNSTNPMSMMMGMLNPTQKQAVNQFQNKNAEQQAEEIARMCNEKGISKDELSNLVNSFKKL